MRLLGFTGYLLTTHGYDISEEILPLCPFTEG